LRARLAEKISVSESAVTIGQPVCCQNSVTRRNGAIRDGDGRQGMQTVTLLAIMFGTTSLEAVLA
jgi:hypothetical protein